MARRTLSLLIALVVALGAAAAAVAVEGDAEAEEEVATEVELSADEGMPPFLAEDFEGELPPGIADKWDGDPEDLGDLPYGLAKKLDPCLLPPGQAKKGVEPPEGCGEELETLEGEVEGLEDEAEELEASDEGMPPFLAEDYEGELPPGIAKKWDGTVENAGDLPYGLAKKVDPSVKPHGQAKKSEG